MLNNSLPNQNIINNLQSLRTVEQSERGGKQIIDCFLSSIQALDKAVLILPCVGQPTATTPHTNSNISDILHGYMCIRKIRDLRE